MISGSNEQLLQLLEYTLLQSDCHGWWMSKMQSGREKERYAINFCFKLGKNATETHGMLQTALWASCMNRASVFEWHKRFKEGRESARDDERYWRSKDVNTPELIDQRARVRLGLLCWGFKGVQEETPRKEASTLQIASVAFQPAQCTSPQLHPCHRLFEQDGHQDNSSPSLSSRPCSLWLLDFSSPEAVIMRQLGRWKRLWRMSMTRSHKRTSIGHSGSCWNSTTSTLQLEEMTSKGTSVSCVYYQ